MSKNNIKLINKTDIPDEELIKLIPSSIKKFTIEVLSCECTSCSFHKNKIVIRFDTHVYHKDCFKCVTTEVSSLPFDEDYDYEYSPLSERDGPEHNGRLIGRYRCPVCNNLSLDFYHYDRKKFFAECMKQYEEIIR